jgi:hypothetical protein
VKLKRAFAEIVENAVTFQERGGTLTSPPAASPRTSRRRRWRG